MQTLSGCEPPHIFLKEPKSYAAAVRPPHP